MDLQFFEQIMEKCPKKKVISLCKKLAKKCSFKNGADMENLCHLAYWLYIYDLSGPSMECISLTHQTPFDQNYNVWTFIHSMWGLEIRILKEQSNLEESQKIIDSINEHYLMPTKLEPSIEKRQSAEAKRRSRFTYEDVIRKSKIEASLANNDIKGANEWRFIALLGMIGNTETGIYPKLNDSKEQINILIKEYIQMLCLTK